MVRSQRLFNNDEGVTLTELLVALLILAVLVAIAIPMFSGATDQARDASATAEVRTVIEAIKAINTEDPNVVDLDVAVLSFTPGTRLDAAAALTGVKIERSLDNAICMWRISQSGVVYGAWEAPVPGGYTLFAELAALPATCPITADTAGAGFTATIW